MHTNIMIIIPYPSYRATRFIYFLIAVTYYSLIFFKQVHIAFLHFRCTCCSFDYLHRKIFGVSVLLICKLIFFHNYSFYWFDFLCYALWLIKGKFMYFVWPIIYICDRIHILIYSCWVLLWLNLSLCCCHKNLACYVIDLVILYFLFYFL